MPNVNSIFKSNFLSNLMKEFNLFQIIEDLLNDKCLCQDPSCNIILTFDCDSNYKAYYLNCKKDIDNKYANLYFSIEIKNDKNEICLNHSNVCGSFVLNDNQLYFFLSLNGLFKNNPDLNLNLKCSENQLNLIHKLIQKQEIKLIFS